MGISIAVNHYDVQQWEKLLFFFFRGSLETNGVQLIPRAKGLVGFQAAFSI